MLTLLPIYLNSFTFGRQTLSDVLRPACCMLSFFIASKTLQHMLQYHLECIAVALAESGLQNCKILLLPCGQDWTWRGVPSKGKVLSLGHGLADLGPSSEHIGFLGSGGQTLPSCDRRFWNVSIKLKWVWRPLSQLLLRDYLR